MERIIHIGFLIAASVIVAMGLLLYAALLRSHESSQHLYRINAILDVLQEIRENYIRTELTARKYATSGNPADLTENAFWVKQIEANIAALKPLLEADPAQQRRQEQLTAAFARRPPVLDASLPDRQAGDNATQITQARQEFFDIASNISGQTLRDFKAYGEAAQHRFHNTLVTLASMVALGLLILVPVYLNVIRQIRARKHAELQQQESSEILRLTVDSVEGMIVYLDRDQRYKFHNKAYVQTFGGGKESVVGETVAQVLGQDLYQQVRDGIEQVLAGGTAVRNEVRHVLANNRNMDVRVSLVPHLADNGQVQGLIGQITDITEFRRKEALLLETTTVQKAILDSAHFSIITVDRDGIIRSFNVGAERMLGYDAGELIGKASPARYHDEAECRARALALSQELGVPVEPGYEVFIARARRGHVDEGEWTYVRKDGSRLPVFLSITALRDSQDDIIGYLGIAFDITRQKETERQLKQARAEAEAASRAKSAFLATMSHEIRTPMNGVLGMAELLARSKLARYQAEMVQTIRESAGVLLNLIDDILDFSKIEAGRLELEEAPLSIREVAEGICTSLLPVAARQGVNLNLFVSPAVPERVMADDMRLRQMLYNLMGNAIKFCSGQPGQRGRVWLRAEVAQAAPLKIAFRIIDNGIGMPPDALGKLFTAFTQAEASTTRRFGGTGLGLAICKRLVELGHGEITVDSAPGAGSSFTVVLPFALAAEQPNLELPDLSGLECIVIESPQIGAADLLAYLAPQGAEVHIAADLAAAALLAAGATLPLVVVQDASVQKVTPQVLQDVFADAPDARHLLLTRGNRRQLRIEAANVISLDADALMRRVFLHSVVVAAGRISPEMWPDQVSGKPVSEGAPPGIAEARTEGRLILVAEDDAINQKVILRQLALLGYTAEIACTGIEALRMWRAGNYDLLLTDLNMPDLDGYGLAAAIRGEESADKRLPILALTANALRGESSRAIASGMDGYLTKPVQLDVLQKVLQKWMPARKTAPTGTAPGAAMATDAPAVNINVLKALVGDDNEAVHELLTAYLAAARQQAEEVHQAIDAGNIGLAGAIAHKLKSSSLSVGALKLADICAGLERAGKAADQAAALHCMPKFDRALAAVESALASALPENQEKLAGANHANPFG